MSKIGKVALVTGAASGIGEEAARLFAEHGAFVVIADIQDELGQKVADSIGNHRASYHHCDVRDESQVESAVNYTVREHKKLDVLFSNAGVIGPLDGILDLDLAAFDATVATNVRGVAATIKHAARAMVAAGTRGSIVCTASVAAAIGGAGPHAYTVSKHALVGLEVEVNSAAAANLKGVVLRARHVAEAALFLASDESEYISGHNLAVDGGFTAVSHSYAAM
ncbi:hypothetical protein EUGRSUZ_K03571 [Eucalyptus grandis]|uniref:Uncharacterized protein n=2 Tax=Eucalyptus grandis TaxID=71139 RepID=A0ACC3J0L5_EUCGR|nr:hypothetical protein EUGRSUZ_K03571 [Eucalyptus grandis]